MADEKYIKLSDAKDVFYYTLADGDCAIADYRGAYELLESVEAADVQSVVRGRFKYLGQFSECALYQCSNCKGTVDWPTKFCPNCGADMRGNSNAG